MYRDEERLKKNWLRSCFGAFSLVRYSGHFGCDSCSFPSAIHWRSKNTEKKAQRKERVRESRRREKFLKINFSAIRPQIAWIIISDDVEIQASPRKCEFADDRRGRKYICFDCGFCTSKKGEKRRRVAGNIRTWKHKNKSTSECEFVCFDKEKSGAEENTKIFCRNTRKWKLQREAGQKFIKKGKKDLKKFQSRDEIKLDLDVDAKNVWLAGSFLLWIIAIRSDERKFLVRSRVRVVRDMTGRDENEAFIIQVEDEGRQWRMRNEDGNCNWLELKRAWKATWKF